MKALTARLAASGRARPLCFQTKNADVSVLLDGEEVYRFTSRENLTGKGYGTAFHYVGLSSADAGRTVRICLRGVLDGCEGRVWRTHLCPSVRYVQMYTAEKVLSFRLSLLIAFFGFLLFTFYLFMPDKAAMPFDAAALGAAVLAFGLWSMIDTGMPPSSATASSSALQYTASAGEPEKSIRALLKYLGTELHAKRTYIFEDQGNGVWHGTYEWFAEGMAPRKPELLDLPYEGLIDALYPVFQQENRLIVSEREQCRALNPILYETLCVNQVERMVVGLLEANGRLIGLFGVDDAPKARAA